MNQATEHGSRRRRRDGWHITTQNGSPRWRRAPDLEVLGPAQDSGLRDATYLVRRWDDQMLQLTELLHLVLIHVEPSRSPEEIAELVSAADGRTLTPAGLEYLIEQRLAPLGLVEQVGGEEATARPPRANPLLALTVKGILIPPTWTRRLAALAAPGVLAPGGGARGRGHGGGRRVVVAGHADFTGALLELFLHPTLALVMYAILTTGAVIHELGHATACRYGGAEPGAIGVGLYIVFPAFYTDVTDSYRLGRAGRVRTDLGGLYFNAWCVVALGLAYLQTGEGVLLLSGLVMQIQMLQQLIPVVRFDGYYVLARPGGCARPVRAGRAGAPQPATGQPARPAGARPEAGCPPTRHRMGAGGGAGPRLRHRLDALDAS